MSAISKPVAAARGRVAALSRSRPDDDPEFIAARQNLKALSLEEQIQRTVNSWPELTTDQMARLSGLFRSARGDAA
ncbi:hypothetical protein GCM10027405_31420 [Arthrobacter alkaliphilus]|uniref:hypothetical protein n=1 Tax=Arthrobacter alkaliphilus TaxID=369936 RepID=UPI001F2DFF48|nr:hypothetical protein [Arthrobacter alkaliphilus]